MKRLILMLEKKIKIKMKININSFFLVLINDLKNQK